MSDEDEKSGLIDLSRPKEEALRLKTLAEEKYNSGDLNSAVAYAQRARDLYPLISGLPEILAAFEVLRAAAVPVLDSTTEKQKPTPDYYRILHVQRFSHINSIQKQYKKLALTLHPDKNPFEACEEAFKLVGEAARVLSDKIRRKEYDTRLRIVMQSEAAQAVALGPDDAKEAFSTACSACQLLHQFERKYLGHNLICPNCKKMFKATEVKEGRNGEGIGVGQTRISARLKERVAKGGYVGIVEKSGLGMKRRNTSVGKVSEKCGVKSKRVDAAEKLGEVDGDGVENCSRLKKMENFISVNGDGRVGGGVEEALGNGEAEIVEKERSQRAETGEDESMTLSQIQMMVKKNKRKKELVNRKLTTKVNEVNAEKFKANKGDEDIKRECDEGDVGEEESVVENVREEEMAKKWEEEEANLRRKKNRRRVPKIRNLKDVNASAKSRILSEEDRLSEQCYSEVLLVEKETEKESDLLNLKSTKNSDIEMDIAGKKGEVEIMPAAGSDFS